MTDFHSPALALAPCPCRPYGETDDRPGQSFRPCRSDGSAASAAVTSHRPGIKIMPEIYESNPGMISGR